MNENDPTQQGGQDEEIKPTINPRNAAMAQIAQRTQADGAADLSDFDEESGEITPNATQVAAAPAPAAEPDAPAPVVAAPAPVAPRMLTIIVDGQPIEVEESRIIEAGKRTLQKDQAADRRLQEATQTKRQAEALLAQAQRLSTTDTAPTEQAPSQDAPQQQTQATKGLDPEMLDKLLEDKLYLRDANKAREKFLADFPEIAGDPHLMNIAASMEQQRLDTATALGESFGDPFEAYRKHGESVQAWLTKRSGTTPVAAIVDKMERKRTITAIPAINARAPAPATPKVLTTSEQIDAIREQRKLGRPVPRLQ